MFNLQKLKDAIEKSGLKQKIIADRCGLSSQALSLVLNGKRKCSIGEALKICRAINADIAEFLE